MCFIGGTTIARPHVLVTQRHLRWWSMMLMLTMIIFVSQCWSTHVCICHFISFWIWQRTSSSINPQQFCCSITAHSNNTINLTLTLNQTHLATLIIVELFSITQSFSQLNTKVFKKKLKTSFFFFFVFFQNNGKIPLLMPTGRTTIL